MTIRGRLLSIQDAGRGRHLTIQHGGKVAHVPLSSEIPMPPVGAYVQVEDGTSGLQVTVLGSPPSTLSEDAERWHRSSTSGVSRMERLWQRARMIRAIRAVLDADHFLEVQSPLLLRASCPDVHIDSFAVCNRFLATSTEYQLKRMFAGGFDRVYSLTQNFREGDVGPWHNDEFTMLEWARAYESMAAIEEDARRVVEQAFSALDPTATSIERDGHRITIRGVPWERLSVREALGRHLGFEVDAAFSLPSLQAEVARVGLDIPARFTQDRVDLLTLLLDRIQPFLGTTVPTFLVDWPSVLTTSAPPLDGHEGLAARSELFIDGLEVADGFPFLCDGGLQAQLFDAANRERESLGKPRMEPDLKYLQALNGGFPPGAGMALGIERLVMALTGEREIRHIMAFATDEL